MNHSPQKQESTFISKALFNVASTHFQGQKPAKSNNNWRKNKFSHWPQVYEQFLTIAKSVLCSKLPNSGTSSWCPYNDSYARLVRETSHPKYVREKRREVSWAPPEGRILCKQKNLLQSAIPCCQSVKALHSWMRTGCRLVHGRFCMFGMPVNVSLRCTLAEEQNQLFTCG